VGDLAVVLDGKPHRLTETGRSGQPHDQRVARAAKLERRTTQTHLPHPQPTTHVQHDRIQPGPERHDRGRHLPLKCGPIPVEVADLEALMDQIVVVGRGVAAAEDSFGVGLLGWKG
jgi:hypothetical protein